MSKVPILGAVLELLLTTKKTPINNNNTTPINNNSTMEQEEIKRKLYSSVLFLAAHPEQCHGSEMMDRLDDLIDIYNHLNK